MHIDEKINKQL